MHMKQLRKRKSIPLETVTENRAAEMDGSYEVRPFQSVLYDRNIIKTHPEYAHRIIYEEKTIMASPKVICEKFCKRICISLLLISIPTNPFFSYLPRHACMGLITLARIEVQLLQQKWTLPSERMCLVF